MFYPLIDIVKDNKFTINFVNPETSECLSFNRELTRDGIEFVYSNSKHLAEYRDMQNNDSINNQIEKLLIESYRENLIKNETFIYFILSETRDKIKIGKADNVHTRFNQLNVLCGGGMELLYYYRVPSIKVEKILHRKFKKFRLLGEWFTYSNEISLFIEKLKNEGMELLDDDHSFEEVLEFHIKSKNIS